MMDAIAQLLLNTFTQVWITFTHNWPFLVLSTLVAAGLKQYMDPKKVSAWLTRYRRAGVVGATAIAVGTPLCSCGTMAILLGMMASMMPWAPVVAFMVASPLTSPEELIYSAGLFGWPFALAFFVSSILLGLLGGATAAFFESRGWLTGQARFAAAVEVQESCGCGSVNIPAQHPNRLAPVVAAAPVRSGSLGLVAVGASGGETGACCTVDPTPALQLRQVTISRFMTEVWLTGRRLLVMFFGFAFIGYMLNGLIPAEWVAAVFGAGNVYSIPLAATLGLPLYVNTEASLPLVRALMDSGMSQGAALAFLITGAGTSIGAVAGTLTIARWRVLALVVGTLWFGAVVMGYLYNLIILPGL